MHLRTIIVRPTPKLDGISGMDMKKAAKAPGEKAIRALLEKHHCPVPFHEVRTRFLGAIATPELSVSPLGIVWGLWGGVPPILADVDEAEKLLEALLKGLWNDLTLHEDPSHPFRLTRLPIEPTAENFERYGRVRYEELHGFIEGLFNGAKAIDLPERAHEAVGHLTELRGMLAGIRGLASRDAEADDRAQLTTLFRSLRDLTRIMETEIHAAVLSCTRARLRGLEASLTERPTVH